MPYCDLQLREAMAADDGDLTKMLGMIESKLAKSNTGFFVGDSPTIADCAFLPIVRQLRSGKCRPAPAMLSPPSCLTRMLQGAWIICPQASLTSSLKLLNSRAR